jgi:hypothetical protein
MPATHGPRIDLHQDGEVHARLVYTDGGHIPHPHLIGVCELQVVHQVRVPRVGVGPSSGPGAACRALTRPSPLTPQPRHGLAVDLDLCAVQQGSDPPVPRRRPDRGAARHGRLERGLIPGSRLVIIVAPRIGQHAADPAPGVVLPPPVDDLALGLERWCKMVVAFVKLSCSSVKRPTRRSHSATRMGSWS